MREGGPRRSCSFRVGSGGGIPGKLDPNIRGLPRHSVMQRRQLLRREAAALDSAAPRQPHSLPQGFSAFQVQRPGAGPRVGG